MKATIAVLPGDGIGPEIIEQAVRVLHTIAERFGHDFTFTKGLIGGAAIDATGNPLPEETIKLCESADAILFGTIGDPKYDNDPSATVRPEQGILGIRKAMGLYANIRPVFTFPSLLEKSPLKTELVKGVDFVVIRELVSGIYFGKRGRNEKRDAAFDTAEYTKKEIERVVKYAFSVATSRHSERSVSEVEESLPPKQSGMRSFDSPSQNSGSLRMTKSKLTVVDKANVLETSRLWRETVQAMESDYPDVSVEYLFVDNAAMQLIKAPGQFDVMVTENMFGDILTDEASVITGSLGMLPSASIGEKTSLYEPIHGSFPRAAGQNIANPIGTILSAAMLLEYSFGLKKERDAIYAAVEQVLNEGYGTKDIATDASKILGTREMGEKIQKTIFSSDLF